MTTVRDPADQPEVRHEDPETLEAQRVDQEDEIVGPAPRAGRRGSERPAPPTTKKGAESSQL
jgi:hypothetical protein